MFHRQFLSTYYSTTEKFKQLLNNINKKILCKITVNFCRQTTKMTAECTVKDFDNQITKHFNRDKAQETQFVSTHNPKRLLLSTLRAIFFHETDTMSVIVFCVLLF